MDDRIAKLFVGYEMVLATDLRKFAATPKAPSNYKDPKLILQYINNKEKEMDKSLAKEPIFGYAVNLSVKSSYGVFDWPATDCTDDPSVWLVKELNKMMSWAVIGIGVGQFMKSLAARASALGVVLQQPYVGLNMEVNPKPSDNMRYYLIDPYALLSTGSSSVDAVGLLQALGYFKGRAGLDVRLDSATELRKAAEFLYHFVNEHRASISAPCVASL